MTQRLPTPYRPEADIVRHHLQSLAGALDWPAAAQAARPWVEAVRDHPPPFWAMESLLQGVPDLQRRRPGPDAAGRGAAARARRRDGDRADGRPARAAPISTAPPTARWRGYRRRPSRCRRSSCPMAEHETGLWAKLGARSVVAATLRAVQLLGRQFVLAQDIGEAMHEARCAHGAGSEALRFSYDMLGEGARTDADALRYLASYQNGIEAIGERAAVDRRGGTERRHLDQAQRLASALRRCPARARAGRTGAARVELCERAARANVNLTIDAEEVDRLELSLDVFEALAARVAQHHPQWRASAWRCRPTRPARWNWSSTSPASRASTACASCAAWSRAPTGTPRSSGRRRWACRTIRCSRTSTTPTSAYLACARALLAGAGRHLFAVRDAQRRHDRGDPADGARRCHQFRIAALARHGRGRVPRGLDSQPARSGAACTRRWGGTATCWPISCAGCSRTAPTRRSCTSSPTSRWPWTSCWSRRLRLEPRAVAALAARPLRPRSAAQQHRAWT